jgi:hypothetical protein
MNSARARGMHRIRQATAVLAGVGVTVTGAAVGLAHASATSATSATSGTAASTTLDPSSSSSSSTGSSVQLGAAGGVPQAQSGGS